MPKYRGISPEDNEKGTLGTAKKRWEKLYVKEIESDTVSGINANIEYLATTAENSVANAVAAKNAAVDAKAAAETAAETAATAAAGIQSVVETDVDNTLSIAGVAADAKVTGDWLRDIAKPVTLDTSMPATAYAEEYMKVTTDSEGRVLYGVKRDGTFTWQKGVPKHVVEACNPTMESDEYLYLIKDPENRVIFAIKRDGSITWQKGVPQVVKDAISPTINNEEYVYLITDPDNHVLFTIKKDGSIDWQKGVPKPIQEKIFTDKIDNDEFVQLTQDADGKLIEGVTAKGEKKFFSKLTFSDKSIESLEQILKERGFSGGTTDWTNNKELQIPMPKCAVVDFSNISDIPQEKGVNMQGIMSFWDMQGNYFKKRVIMNAQGQWSMRYPKKNIAIDICNDEWISEDTFKLKLGEWVSQDSYHLKAYWVDFFKAKGPVAYKFMDGIWGTRNFAEDRPWKKALVNMDDVDITSKDNFSTTDMMVDTGARNMPDGFPCLVYLNGEFYGVYSFQLKKHRDNMHQDKSNHKHIHLDGGINATSLFGGDVAWDSVEVRNPKGLYCMDGSKYDGDTNMQEIIDSTSPFYDNSNSKHIMSARTKEHILRFSRVIPLLKEADLAYRNNRTSANLNAVKQLFEASFDVDNQIDYLIFSDVVNNWDGIRNNAQWCTYNGDIWYVCPYDLDEIFSGTPLTNHVSTSNSYPWYYVYTYYTDEMERRYAELRNANIITTRYIMDIVADWVKNVGVDNYDKEISKWPSSGKDDVYRLAKWIETSIHNMDVLYNYNGKENTL